jgi:hypothetical protein
MNPFILRALHLMRLTLYAFLVILGPSMSDAGSLSRVPETISGYGGYQFGMSLEEAKRVDARAQVTPCDYKETAFCLERPDTFFGEPGLIRVLFSTESMRLSRINLSFDRLAGTDGACKRGSTTVVEALLKRFGPSNKTQDGKIFWYGAVGGAVSFLDLCVDDDSGMIVVSYEPAGGF